MRMIVSFEKGALVRHIGHLDLLRSMQRALRRSGLPIRYSQGYNPHVVQTFASPLSVGIWGTHELMDVGMEREIPPEMFVSKLNEALPEAIFVHSAQLVEDTYPALMSLVAGASYDLVFDEPIPTLESALSAYLAQGEILAIRKTKSGEKESNIKPMIYHVAINGNHLTGTFSADSTATLKPDVLVRSLSSFAGVDAPHFIAARTCLYKKGENGLEPIIKEMNA